MSETDNSPTEDDLEQTYSDEPTYTVDVNGVRYALSEEARREIQARAEREYARNEMFSCWWKVASPEQYEPEEWEENVHEAGDPVLVIETRGPMVPADDLDQLNVEMQEADPFGGMDSGDGQSHDSGNGMRTLDPSDAPDGDDAEKTIGRTHFEHTPRDYEDVPSPDGEEEDKLPPAPEEMGEHPVMAVWLPDHPDIEHTWSSGEALVSATSWVEWNVQQKANQPRPEDDESDSHDHWQNLLESMGCTIVAEQGPSQEPGADDSDEAQDEQTEDIGPKYNGDNWAV